MTSSQHDGTGEDPTSPAGAMPGARQEATSPSWAHSTARHSEPSSAERCLFAGKLRGVSLAGSIRAIPLPQSG